MGEGEGETDTGRVRVRVSLRVKKMEIRGEREGESVERQAGFLSHL